MVVKVLRKSLSVALLLVLAPLMALQIQLHAVTAVLIDHTVIRDVVKDSLRSTGVYAMLAVPLGQTLAALSPAMASVSGGRRPLLAATRIADALHSALSQDSLQTVSEAAIDGFNAWLFGKTEQVTIDIRPIQGPVTVAMRNAVGESLATFPACTPAQLSAPVSCQPQADTLAQNIPAAKFSVLHIRPHWLFHYTLRLPVRLATVSATGVRYVGWAIVVLFLTVLAALNYDRWHSPLPWLGAVGIAGGLIAMVVAGLVRFAAGIVDPGSLTSVLARLSITVETVAMHAGTWALLAGVALVAVRLAVSGYERKRLPATAPHGGLR